MALNIITQLTVSTLVKCLSQSKKSLSNIFQIRIKLKAGSHMYRKNDVFYKEKGFNQMIKAF